MTWVRRYLDADTVYHGFYAFANYDNKLCAFDKYPVANGRVLYSTDGLNWNTLFNALSAAFGNFGTEDGKDMAVYNNSLFTTLYRSDAINPKILEYNGVAPSGHLTAPLQGNYGAFKLGLWSNRLWALTDATPFVNHRRVIYYYDGIAWTPIVLYDGAAWLDYNCADARAPDIKITHRANHFFNFKGDFYFVCARKGAAGRNAWEVWKYDAVLDNNFSLEFDSESLFQDNMIPTGIIEYDDKAWLFANEITWGGLELGIMRAYTSSDMTTWALESDLSIFLDEFDDGIRDPEWTDEVNSGAINEAAGLLTLSVAAAVNGDWWAGVKNCPFSIMYPGKEDIMVETKLNSYVVNQNTHTGLIIGNTLNVPDAAGGYCWTISRGWVFGVLNGIEVIDVGRAAPANVAITTLPVWFRIRTEGTGAGSSIKFDYSHDGIQWTQLHLITGLTWDFIGLYAKNWGAFNAIDAPYEYFRVYERPGFVWGVENYGNNIYLNTHDAMKNFTKVRRWNEDEGIPELLQLITTNTSTSRSGGMIVY